MRVEALDMFWTDKGRYDLAEKLFHEVILKVLQVMLNESDLLVPNGQLLVWKVDATKACSVADTRQAPRNMIWVQIHPDMVSERNHCSPLVSEIAKAREHIQNSLEKIDVATLEDRCRLEFLDRISLLENQNIDLKSQVSKLNQAYSDVLKRLDLVENRLNCSNGSLKNDDDVDLFASESDEETVEAARIREARVADYKAKKSKKAVIVAKSSLILDVKPWDDETDLQAMEKIIRKIALDGLLWGASKLVPVAFGIKKLSISCVVEDDKVSIDWLTEEIEKLEDFVQSVDIAAFNKI